MKMIEIGSLIIELSNMQGMHLDRDRKLEKYGFLVQHAVHWVYSETTMVMIVLMLGLWLLWGCANISNWYLINTIMMFNQSH